MPWNQPGGDKDPWSGGPKKQGAPNVEEMLGKLSKKFTGSGGKGSGGKGPLGAGAFWLIPLVALFLWLLSDMFGFFIVNEGQRGLVLRFGEYSATKDPGLNWHIPYPFESVEIIDIDSIRSFKHQTTMLTKDENIVDITLAAQFRVKDSYEYVFNVRNPDQTLQQAVESALRESVGKNTMDFILKEGRAEIAESTRKITQNILDTYKAGILVTSITLQDTQPPGPVQASFNDVTKAREDKERFINEAQTYNNSVLPKARGEAARMTAEANAYKEQIIAEATGNASRFEQLMNEYQKAPDVTRERLYLETIESVYANTSKVMMSGGESGGNSLMYLPLDKLMSNRISSENSQSRVLQAPETIRSNTPEGLRQPSRRTGREVLR